MKRLLLMVLLAACVSAPRPDPTQGTARTPVAADGSIAFVGVHLIPMTREVGVVRSQTVIVRDGRIVSIGDADSTAVPPGAEVIESRAMYLMPGLADMHAHLEYFENPAMLEMFTRNGVTFVRSMDGRPLILEWKRAIEEGELAGPSIQTAGPLLDGDPPSLPDNTVVRTPEEGRAAVAAQQEAGYDFIKVYTGLAGRTYEAILEEARTRGIPVAGHVPRHSTIGVALAGHASLEHLADFDELIEADSSPVRALFHWSKLYLAMETDPAKVTAAAKRTAEAGVAVVPTLVQTEHALARSATLDAWMQREELNRVPPDVRAHWQARVQATSARLRGDDWEIVDRGRENRRQLVKALSVAGVMILAGTDTPNPFVVPGISLHRELQLLVEAGLTPKMALAAATREAAAFAGEEELWGTVEVGKRADLVLLRANPLLSISATADPVGVMARGVWGRIEN